MDANTDLPDLPDQFETKDRGTRVPDAQAQEILKHLQEPWLPQGGDYEIVELAAEADNPALTRQKIIEVLGIEESPVKPTSPPTDSQPTRKRFGSRFFRNRTPDLSKGKRSLNELKLSDGGWWRPIRPTSRTIWPAKEISMEWYTDNYNALYLRTKEFVETYFGYNIIRSLELPGQKHAWLGIPSTLRKYIALVARQDPNTSAAGQEGWDYLLSDRQLREFVITGVMGRVFDRFIWQDLLFGASEQQKEVLEKADRLTAELDGFPRTAIRADNIRALIGGDLVTPLFWEKVDELTLRIVKLLLPLIRLMDVNFKRSREVSLRVVYQEMYYLVFQAALLGLGIRWSHDIFRFSWPVLGSPFELEQENVDFSVYQRSEDRAKRLEEGKGERTRKERRRADKGKKISRFGRLRGAAVGLKDGVKNKVVSIAMAGQDPVSIQARRDRILPPDELSKQLRMAKVYIVTWPALFRHEVVGEMPKHPVTGYLDTEGERVTVIMKSPVLYYSGLEGPQGDHYERIPTLEEHVLGKRRLRFWKILRRWAIVLSLLTIGWVTLMLTAGWFFPSLGALMHNINYFVGGTIKAVLRQAALWFLTVMNNLARFVMGGWKVLRFLSYAVRNQFADWGGYERPLGGPEWPTGAPLGEAWYKIRPPLGPYVLGYPKLDVETLKRLLHVIWGEIRWLGYNSIEEAVMLE